MKKKKTNKNSKRITSLRTKILILTLIFTIVIDAGIIAGFSYVFVQQTKKERIQNITMLSKSIKASADTEAMSENLLYCYDNINSDDANEQNTINQITDSYKGVYDTVIDNSSLSEGTALRMYVFTYENDSIVYLFDTTDKIELFKPMPIEDDDRYFLEHFSEYEKGCERTSKIFGNQYFSASQKLINYNENENRQCYVLIDYSVDYFVRYSQKSTLFIAGFALFLAVIIVPLVLYIVNKKIVKPIVSMSNAFKNIDYDSDDENQLLTNLNINTGDEIEVLYNSILKANEDLKDYMLKLNTAIAERERINSELEIAGKLQDSCMPRNSRIFLDKSKFDIAAQSVPAKMVGGDFYDCFMLDKDRLVFVVADVSGKGIASAIFMMKTKSSIRSLLTADIPLSEFLTNLNQTLTKENNVDMFVTLWLGVYNTATQKLNYVNAGHNPPYIMHNNGSYEQLKDLSGLFLGEIEGIRYKEFETELSEGDSIFLYTDGITEANNADKEFYGENRLVSVLNNSKNLESEGIIRNVKDSVKAFENGVEPFDDATMLCLSIQREINNIVINSELSELEKAFGFLEEWLYNKNIPQRKVSEIQIIADEVLNNIISYGKATIINISISINANKICLKFSDNGIQFNPLKNNKHLEIDTPLMDRGIGGMGIFMVRELSDSLVYDYADNQNCLIVYKKLSEK